LAEENGDKINSLLPLPPAIRARDYNTEIALKLTLFPLRLAAAFNSWDFDTLNRLIDIYCDKDIEYRFQRTILRGREAMKNVYMQIADTSPDFTYVVKGSKLVTDSKGVRSLIYKVFFSETRIHPGDEEFRRYYLPREGAGSELCDFDPASLTSPGDTEEKRAIVVERVVGQRAGYIMTGKAWGKLVLNDQHKFVRHIYLWKLTDLASIDMPASLSSSGILAHNGR
jgi:hypothetical protein